ncbi:MAG: RluA family pseudouridine synthase [Candidatus Acidiferrales bacterium]
MKQLRIVVPAQEDAQRLDRWLAACLPELSRTRIQELIAEGRVRINGAPAKPSRKIEAGEIVEVEAAARPALAAQPEAIALDVLYEDDDVAVVNKPAGMVVHAGAGAASASGTLVNALLHRYTQLSSGNAEGAGLRPGIVHRLDKETSGVVVIARNDHAHAQLGAQFSSRKVQKTYLALVHGRLKGQSGAIELPVARDLHRRTRMTTRRREGRAASTHWRVLLRLESGAGRARTAFTLTEVDLRTGRTHQIRVHFSAIGHPVVGDTLYGAPAQIRIAGRALPRLPRNFLHAARICFLHPRFGTPVEVRAPLSEDLQSYLRQLAEAMETTQQSVDAVLRAFI